MWVVGEVYLTDPMTAHIAGIGTTGAAMAEEA